MALKLVSRLLSILRNTEQESNINIANLNGKIQICYSTTFDKNQKPWGEKTEKSSDGHSEQERTSHTKPSNKKKLSPSSILRRERKRQLKIDKDIFNGEIFYDYHYHNERYENPIAPSGPSLRLETMADMVKYHKRKQRQIKTDRNKISVKRSQLEAEYLKSLKIPQCDGNISIQEKSTEKVDEVTNEREVVQSRGRSRKYIWPDTDWETDESDTSPPYSPEGATPWEVVRGRGRCKKNWEQEKDGKEEEKKEKVKVKFREQEKDGKEEEKKEKLKFRTFREERRDIGNINNKEEYLEKMKCLRWKVDNAECYDTTFDLVNEWRAWEIRMRHKWGDIHGCSRIFEPYYDKFFSETKEQKMERYKKDILIYTIGKYI